jgi:hypothetical protein
MLGHEARPPGRTDLNVEDKLTAVPWNEEKRRGAPPVHF